MLEKSQSDDNSSHNVFLTVKAWH